MTDISITAKKALDMLNRSGYEAYVVGGMVRNSLMGIETGDIDITTDALPQQIKTVFDGYNVIETGIQHGTVTVIIDSTPVEITTYRTESGYADNRHPDSVNFTTSLMADCSRRDFTVNAICYNPQKGIVDYFEGTKDIENRIIRCVGDPDTRFREDALRILRAVRFAAVLDFEIEENTKTAIFKNRQLLQNVSAERIYSELTKMLLGKNIRKTILEYAEVIGVVIPEIIPAIGFDQQNIHHIYDVLEHTAVAVESCPPVPVLRWAALLHDLGKPDCFTIDENGTGHFYGHGNISHIHAENILKRLKVSNEDYNTITKLVKYHDNYIETNEKAVRRALNRYGEDFLRLLLVLKRADNAGQNIQLFNRKEEYDTLEELINSVIEKQQCFSLKQLAVNGDDLSAIGIPPSKETGMILNRLLEMVINGDIPNERAILLAEAATIHTQNNVL